MREVTIDMGAVYCAIQMRRILTNQVDTLIPCSLCWCLFFIHCSFETRSGFTSENFFRVTSVRVWYLFLLLLPLSLKPER